MNIQDFLPYLNDIFTVALIVGALLVARRGYFKEVGERQDRLIGTLKTEVDTLRDKVDDLEKERSTQDRVIATIRMALRTHGLRVIIANDFVTLQDLTGKSTTTAVQSKPSLLVPLDESEAL